MFITALTAGHFQEMVWNVPWIIPQGKRNPGGLSTCLHYHLLSTATWRLSSPEPLLKHTPAIKESEGLLLRAFVALLATSSLKSLENFSGEEAWA